MIDVNKIRELKAQGFSNNQIIEMLQRDGYKSHEIFEALNYAALPETSNQNNLFASPLNQNKKSFDNINQRGNNMAPTDNMMNSVSNEELIESIIEEKWNELVSDLNKIVEWKESSEDRLIRLEEEVKNLKESFDKLHSSILGRVNEYDNHILSIGAELKAIEKAFSKVLPLFAENVAALEKITADLKGLKKKK